MCTKKFFWLIGFIWLIWPLVGYSAVYTVTNSEEFTQVLREAAQNGEDDTIILQPGTFAGYFSFNSLDHKNLTIQGLSSDETLIKGPIFIQGSNIANFKISNITLNCQNDSWSCLEIIGFSKIEIDGLKAENSQANYIIRIFSKGEAKISNSAFYANNAVFSLIYSAVPKTLVIDSIFKDNKIKIFGVIGSQFLDESWNIDIERNNFINNTSSNYGSCVYINGEGYIKFDNNLVYNSKSTGGWSSGGAIFIHNSDSELVSNKFQENEVTQFGGSIFASGNQNKLISKKNEFSNDKAFDGSSLCLANIDFDDIDNTYNNEEKGNVSLILSPGIYNYISSDEKSNNNSSDQNEDDNPSSDDSQINKNCNQKYDQGYNDGYNDGYKDGYIQGKKDGYNQGYEDGYQAAIEFCKNNPSSCGIIVNENTCNCNQESDNTQDIDNSENNQGNSETIEGWNTLFSDQISVTQWLYYDSKTKLMTYNCYLTAKEDINGPIILILKTNKKIRNDLPQGAEIKGYTSEGYPYFEIISSNEILKAGEKSWPIKIYFDLPDKELQYWRSLDKKDIPFEIEIRNMPSLEASDIDITNDLRIVRYFRYDPKADLFYMTFFAEPPKVKVTGPVYAVFTDKNWSWEIPSVSSYVPSQPDGYTSEGYPYIELVPEGKIFDSKSQRYRIYFQISSTENQEDLWNYINSYKWFAFWTSWDKRRDSICLDRNETQLCIDLPIIAIRTEIN